MHGEGGPGSGHGREDRFEDPAAWAELLAALNWLPLAARGWSRWWWRPGPGGRLVVCVAQQAPHIQADHQLDAVSVLDSVIAHAFQAGLALQDVQAAGPAAGVDHALGRLEEIARQARDLAFQLAVWTPGYRPLDQAAPTEADPDDAG